MGLYDSCWISVQQWWFLTLKGDLWIYHWVAIGDEVQGLSPDTFLKAGIYPREYH